MKTPTNSEIADILDEIADLLEAEDANPFRIRAYREGADEIRSLDDPVADFVTEHRQGDLTALPKIGEGIAAIIGEYVSSGRSSLLEELKGHKGAEAILSQVSGIGKKLAARIVEELKVETLADLETAAHDGRLAEVEGFGPRRLEGVRAALAGMLSRTAQSRQKDRTAKTNQGNDEIPSVALLLELDGDYRKRAAKDELHKIAPRRFNPNNETWLPVMHTKRDGWLFTVLFSNTAQAHQLGKTREWVVIFYERNGREHQNTVVTETRGPQKGKRVVRGREAESRGYYRIQAESPVS